MPISLFFIAISVRNMHSSVDRFQETMELYQSSWMNFGFLINDPVISVTAEYKRDFSVMQEGSDGLLMAYTSFTHTHAGMQPPNRSHYYITQKIYIIQLSKRLLGNIHNELTEHVSVSSKIYWFNYEQNHMCSFGLSSMSLLFLLLTITKENEEIGKRHMHAFIYVVSVFIPRKLYNVAFPFQPLQIHYLCAL